MTTLPILGRDTQGNLHNYALVSNTDPKNWLTQNVDPTKIPRKDGYHLELWDWENTPRGDELKERHRIGEFLK